ncbi:hypothetical protein PFISCL1PPCAC_16621, partial [Pristionchus fissidentatus]
PPLISTSSSRCAQSPLSHSPASSLMVSPAVRTDRSSASRNKARNNQKSPRREAQSSKNKKDKTVKDKTKEDVKHGHRTELKYVHGDKKDSGTNEAVALRKLLKEGREEMPKCRDRGSLAFIPVIFPAGRIYGKGVPAISIPNVPTATMIADARDRQARTTCKRTKTKKYSGAKRNATLNTAKTRSNSKSKSGESSKTTEGSKKKSADKSATSNTRSKKQR